MERKVILYIAVSLDMFIADEFGDISFLDRVVDEKIDIMYKELYERIDTVVLGRKTYEQIKNILAIDNYPYKDKINYVLSHKNQKNKENIYFENTKIEELIKKLKNEEGKDIWIVGGASIIKPLIAANLIDEYQITMIPTILGKGIKLFDELDEKIELKIKKVEKMKEAVFIEYNK